MSELVSIIIAAYNEDEQHFKEALESLMQQSYQIIEIIIVLDKPDNVNLRKVILEYASTDNRIKTIFNEENIGLANSLNKAMNIAKGDLIARMDSDDISLPNRISNQKKFFDENPDYDIVATNRYILAKDKNIEPDKLISTNNYSVFLRSLKYGCVITHPSVMFRKKLIQEIKGYNDLRSAQDYDLWIRAIRNGAKIKLLEDRLIVYRVHEKSISSNVGKQFLYSELVRYTNKRNIEISGVNIKKMEEKFGITNQKMIEEINKNYDLFIKTIKFINNKKFNRAFSCILKMTFSVKTVKLIVYQYLHHLCVKRLAI